LFSVVFPSASCFFLSFFHRHHYLVRGMDAPMRRGEQIELGESRAISDNEIRRDDRRRQHNARCQSGGRAVRHSTTDQRAPCVVFLHCDNYQLTTLLDHPACCNDVRESNNSMTRGAATPTLSVPFVNPRASIYASHFRRCGYSQSQLRSAPYMSQKRQ